MSAINDVWFIGDRFLNDIYHTFPGMRNHAKLAKEPLPYLYDYFNISVFTTNPESMLKDVLARLVNCVVKALNDNNKLPRFIVVIPNDNNLQHIKSIFQCEGDIKNRAEIALNWVMTRCGELSRRNVTT